MMIVTLQIIVLVALLIALVMWIISFPYPSPLLRRLLSPRKRWPEMQIREWLKSGRFQRTFLTYFNRDPERTPPAGDSLIAPADGLITSAGVHGGIRYLVIALSFWDMHVQRSPVAGRVVAVETTGDGFMDGEGRELAFLREKHCPVQKRVVIDTYAGPVAVRLVTSIAARRIEIWVSVGDRAERGQRIGRILLGSTVVLELPQSAELNVEIGDRVWAGETPVAHIPGLCR